MKRDGQHAYRWLVYFLAVTVMLLAVWLVRIFLLN